MTTSSRILIVDDNPEDCSYYKRYLEREGQSDFTFVIAYSGAKGLQACRTEMPDCILLDFNLPDGDGLDFLAQLRQENGEKCPPVVMVTGQGSETVAVQAMKLGAQDYLVKGFTAHGLRQSIQNAINNAALRRQVEAQQREMVRLSEMQARLVRELERHTTELLEADRRKNEFLAVLAHELRNPLGPIRNAAHIIRLSQIDLPPDVEQARNTIERQVGHMARLIDDLLDVSRIVSGKVQLHKTLVDLSALARSTIEDQHAEFDKSALTLTLSAPASEVTVHGDATRLSQILSNILDNSRKYTPPGGTVSLALSVNRLSNTVLIKVSDSGEGVSPELLGQMFDIFTQADRSLDRSRGGLGLGLAIVKGLVEMHHGKVVAKSRGPGLGCEISVTLPLASSQLQPTKLTSPIPTSVATLRILVVEDNMDAAQCLGTLLKTLGHTVAVAYNGESALQAARTFRPELVLCDIGLPGGMTGFEVGIRFRKDLAIASAYLVALTGYGQEEDKRRASDAGFDLHLTKPVALETLQELPARVHKAGRETGGVVSS